MRNYGPRVGAGVHAQHGHDQIAQVLKTSSRVRLDFTDVESVAETFLDRSLGALVAWHGATVPSVDCVRSRQSKCRGEHRQGVPPSRTDSRAS
jgi:hypothetical protein